VIGNDDVDNLHDNLHDNLRDNLLQVFPPSNSVAVDGILSIEEKFLPGAGENQTPAPLSQEAIKLVQSEVKRAYIAVGCKGYSRVDCFYQDSGRVVILEINTLPALTPATCLFHQALEVGIKPMELIDRIVELGCEAQKQVERVERERVL
jgi:D-alanine-D-alanine ligase